MVAFVVVELPMERLLIVEEAATTRSEEEAMRLPVVLMFAVQLFWLPTFKAASTAPVVGEIVKEVSLAVTEETPVARQMPLTAKQPFAREIPLPNVEEAVVLCTSRVFTVAMPPVKIEVAEPVTLKFVVASEVEVAFVEVALTMTRFVMVEEAEFATKPPEEST